MQLIYSKLYIGVHWIIIKFENNSTLIWVTRSMEINSFKIIYTNSHFKLTLFDAQIIIQNTNELSFTNYFLKGFGILNSHTCLSSPWAFAGESAGGLSNTSIKGIQTDQEGLLRSNGFGKSSVLIISEFALDAQFQQRYYRSGMKYYGRGNALATAEKQWTEQFLYKFL